MVRLDTPLRICLDDLSMLATVMALWSAQELLQDRARHNRSRHRFNSRTRLGNSDVARCHLFLLLSATYTRMLHRLFCGVCDICSPAQGDDGAISSLLRYLYHATPPPRCPPHVPRCLDAGAALMRYTPDGRPVTVGRCSQDSSWRLRQGTYSADCNNH
jgi:hypothetical protein